MDLKNLSKSSLEQLDVLVRWMRDNEVESISGVAGISIKLLDPAKTFKKDIKSADLIQPPGVFSNVDGAGVCSCGHSWVEHDLSGCLHGCSHEVCVSTGIEEPANE